MRARKSLIVFGGDYIKSALGFVTMFFVARLIGAEALGVIGYSLGLLGLFSIFLDLGMINAHVKRVAEGEDAGACVGAFFTFKLAGILFYLLSVGLYVGFFHQSYIVHAGISVAQQRVVFLILLSYYVLDQLTSILTTTFWGREEIIKLSVPTVIGRAFKSVVAISAGYLGFGLIGLAVSYLIDSAVSFGFSIFLFNRAKIPIKKPSIAILKSYFRYALPMMAIIPISALISNLGRVMIEHLSTTQQVGFYFTIQSLIAIPNSISSSAMTVLFPKISSDYASNKLDNLRESVYKSVRYLSMIMTPLVVLLCAQADWVLHLCYGAKFTSAALVLTLLSLSTLVASITRPYSNILYGIEKHQKLAFNSLINLIIMVVANLWLIPTRIFNIPAAGLGASGAALSNLIIWVFSGVFQFWLARRYSSISFSKCVLKHWISGGVMFVGICGARHFLGGWGVPVIVQLCSLSAFGIFLYYLSLVIFGEWTKKDRDYLVWTFDFFKLKNDAINELKKPQETDRV